MNICKKPLPFIALGVALTVYLGGFGNALAGTCVVRGQGLVTAYTYAEQGGYRSRGTAFTAEGRRSATGKIYVVPGKLGIKGRSKSIGGVRIRGSFFCKGTRTEKPSQLHNGWKITDVRYGGSPTAVSQQIFNGECINLKTRDLLTIGKRYNFYITQITLTHPNPKKKCGNDPVSQQIVLRQAFKG